MEKSLLKKSIMGLALALTATAFGYSVSRARADDAAAQSPAAEAQGAFHSWHHRHRRGGGFMLGVCVGQTLAQQGVALPPPTPGQRPQLDQQTRQAIQAAVQQCRAEFSGAQPTPSPSPSESAAAQ